MVKMAAARLVLSNERVTTLYFQFSLAVAQVRAAA